jgi:hypothetical protein
LFVDSVVDGALEGMFVDGVVDGALEGNIGASDGLRSARGTAETAKFWADSEGVMVGFCVGGRSGDLVGRLVGFLLGFAVGGSDGTVMLAIVNIKFLNFLKSSDPSPDAGSHPTAALKPCLQQVVLDVQLFLPIVTSLMNAFELPHSVGFIQPMGLPPPRSRAALTSENIPATTGVETEVPPTPNR